MRSAHRPLYRALVISLVTLGPACSRHDDGPTVGPLPRERTQVALNGVLTADDIGDIGATRVEELIEGRFPGVRVIHRPNGEFAIQIRGSNSFYGNSEPLIVIDGMPVSSSRSLRAIHPHDIERIQVLKDALAGAYGIRGANGVLVITTRKE